MAQTPHAELAIDTASVTNSTTLTTRGTLDAAALAAAGLQNNDVVLCLIWGLFASTNAGTEQVWNVEYDGSAITPSTNPRYDFGTTGNPTTGPSRHGAWPVVVDLGTLADFTVRNQRAGTSANLSLEKFRLEVIKLPGTQNVDWYYNRSTTLESNTTAYADLDNGAVVAWTPSQVEDWAVIAGIAGVVDSASVNFEGRLLLDGSLRQGEWSEEGESTDEMRVWTMIDVLEDLAASSHTLQIETRDDTATAANDHLESVIFAMRTDLWADFYWNVPSNGNVNSDAAVQIATLTPTLTATQDILILGQCKQIVNSPLGAGYPIWMWVRQNGSTVIAPVTAWTSDTSTTNGAGIKIVNANTYDTTDELWAFWLGRLTSQSGTLDLDLFIRTWAENDNNPCSNRMFWVWGMELADAGPEAQDLSGTLFSNAPTFFGGTISPGAVNLAGALFSKAPSFPQGAVTPGAVQLAGTLFEKAPSFAQGAVVLDDGQTLTGTLFEKAPTFQQGAVSTGPVALAGQLFSKAATFFTGAIIPDQPLVGVLFQKAATFLTGTVTPGAVTLAGQLFQKAATFFAGSVFGVIVHPPGPGEAVSTPPPGKVRTTSSLASARGAPRAGRATGAGNPGQTSGGSDLGDA